MRAAALLLALALPIAAPAHAQRVIDGDSLKLGGQSIRLHGIDSPELHQTCDGGTWHPGPLARDALAALIAGQPVECQPIDRDRYGRTVARCYAGGQDLGALMVAAGWAWAFTRYSLDYAGLELRADDQATCYQMLWFRGDWKNPATGFWLNRKSRRGRPVEKRGRGPATIPVAPHCRWAYRC